MAAPPKSVSTPQPGFFKLRMARKAVFVPARIIHNPKTGLWSAVLNGARGQAHENPAKAENVMRVWIGGHEITEEQYEHMLRVKDWAETHSPDSPEAKPKEKIDHGKIPPVF